MTAAMASLATGSDQVTGDSSAFQSLFFLGLLLFADRPSSQRRRRRLRPPHAAAVLGAARWPPPSAAAAAVRAVAPRPVARLDAATVFQVLLLLAPALLARHPRWSSSSTSSSKALPVFAGARRRLPDLAACPATRPRRASLQGIIGTAILAVLVVARWPSRSASRPPSTSRSTRPTTGSRGSSTSTSATWPACPSVVYGLLGLTRLRGAPLGRSASGNGRNLISGGLTLAVLVLPIVIITSSEALRAVPEHDPRGRLSGSARRAGR